ncbi:MAG: hypothetical protein ACI9DC_005622, partial [Gammaproteobacteria bacterium]
MSSPQILYRPATKGTTHACSEDDLSASTGAQLRFGLLAQKGLRSFAVLVKRSRG